MHAVTQTTAFLESIGFTRSVVTCSLVLSEYSETSFSWSSWFPHLFLIASIGFFRYADDMVRTVDTNQIGSILRAAEDERLINQWMDRQRLESGVDDEENDPEDADSSSVEET